MTVTVWLAITVGVFLLGMFVGVFLASADHAHHGPRR